jgi:hypothetical protein
VRAFRYRQEGVPLKEFPEVIIEPIDWDALAEYASELMNEKENGESGG